MSVFNRVRSYFSGASPNHIQGAPLMNQDNRSPAPMATQAIPDNADQTVLYRTSDGSRDIKFWFKNCGANGWRIYILANLDYGRRVTDAHSTHRYYDSELRMHYICWSQSIRTKAGCFGVAQAWAEATLKYITEGRRFG